MNVDPLKTEKRKQKRVRALGTEHPMCLQCGCDFPMLLRPITRKFAEDHHLIGRDNDPALVLALCFNCHALATEDLAKAGVKMQRDPDRRKFAANTFRATAVHFENLSQAFYRYADYMEDASSPENENIGDAK